MDKTAGLKILHTDREIVSIKKDDTDTFVSCSSRTCKALGKPEASITYN